MKIAYLSQTALSDVDFSYIMEAQKIMDITYYILVSPSQRQKAAINLTSLSNKFGIIPALDIPELSSFKKIVNLKKVYVVNFTSINNHQFSKISESYQVYKELKDKKYDVIHLTWPPSYLDFFIYRLRKKLVLTVHDPFPHSSVVSRIREFERNKAFRKCRHLILLNKAQKEKFIEHYQLNNKNVYESRLSCYNYLHMHDNNVGKVNNNQILFFGQIFAHKGVDVLLNAMKIVHETHPEAKLIVAGSGKYWFDLKPYANLDYIEIRNRYIPDDELVGLVSTSAFVVVPYIDATQSGVIMTAYAFNRPCIATNVGALPEMVVDNENGIIVPPKNPVSLASAINKFIESPELIDQFSRAIREKYNLGNLSWKDIVKEHINIYNNVNKSKQQ